MTTKTVPKLKSIRDQLMEPEMSGEQKKLCIELTMQILKLYDSITLSQIIELGTMKSPLLNYKFMQQYGKYWLQKASRNGALREEPAVYDEPIYRILVIA